MNHRHLLPNEIDLLVDGEAGFGVAPLRAHILECRDCEARLSDARVVVDALERLPHLAPDSRLADRVMAQVPVFVPAHVAARDTVTRWMPRSAAARVAAIVAGTSAAASLTLAMLWLAMRGDAVVFMGGVVSDRLSAGFASGVREVTLALLGPSALAAIDATGALGASLLVVGFALTAVCTVLGLRRLTLAGRRA